MLGSSLAVRVCLIAALSLPATIGCRTNTQTGALLGSATGAGLGAIIGHQTGRRDEGAALGAAIGGLGGAVAGHHEDLMQQRDAAMAHAHHAEMSRQAAQRAVTNADLVQMTQGGLSDETIIDAMRSRGVRADTRPEALVQLKQSGVSEAVIRTLLGAR